MGKLKSLVRPSSGDGVRRSPSCRGAFRALWAICCLLGTAGQWGCVGTEFSLPPIASSASTDQGSETWGLGPLLDVRELPTARPDQRTGRPIVEETALRPFFRKYRTQDAEGFSNEYLQVLYPLWQARWADDLFEWRFLWFWWYRARHGGEDGAPEWDLFAPPFFAGGGEAEDEDYFALFPLFGKVESFAAFKHFLFVLFPLYYQVHKNITEPVTFHNITPLIGWTSGGPKDDSHRFLPFYAKWVHEGRFEKYSILWPFIHWHRDRLDQPDPSKLLAVWPFFSIDRSARHRLLSFLWPFFRLRDEWVPAREFEGEVLRDAQHHYHYDLLWPLFRFQNNREFRRDRIFPLYSRYRSEELDSDAWLIPLFWRREERAAEWTRRSFDIAPLFRHEERSYADGRPGDVSTRLWPFFESIREGSGGSRLRFPILIPSDAGPVFRELAANLDPLIELYHDERRPDGSRRLRALFHLIDYRCDGDETRFSVPLLYSNHRGPERNTHDLLWGLIRFGTGRGGTELRLFFLPLLTPEDEGP